MARPVFTGPQSSWEIRGSTHQVPKDPLMGANRGWESAKARLSTPVSSKGEHRVTESQTLSEEEIGCGQSRITRKGS